MRTLIGLMLVGVWCYSMPGAAADGSHGPLGLRIGVGAPVDNKVRDWTDITVVQGLSWFLNHKSGSSLMSAIDIDTQIHAKSSTSGRATGISYTLRQVTHDDGRYKSYTGGGLGLFRTSVDSGTGTTHARLHLGGKAILGRMDAHGRFIEAAYTYTGSSASNGLGASFGIRF